MGRKMIVDESRIFDACALVEEIMDYVKTYNRVSVPFVMEKASQASLLLNQAMEDGEMKEGE